MDWFNVFQKITALQQYNFRSSLVVIYKATLRSFKSKLKKNNKK